MVFDVLICVLFVTVFITGLIRGAGIELLRFLKLIIPFIILYYFGDLMINLLFKTNAINYFVYTVLPDIPFKSTISSLSTQALLYLIVYLLLSLILWRLGSLVLDERIEYFFGKANAIVGGIFSVLWMYVIISYVIIPLYVVNLTNEKSFMTNFILNHPFPFSRAGKFIERSKPTLDRMNEMTNAFQVMDLDGFKNYTHFLNDVEAYVIDLEAKANQLYDTLLAEGVELKVSREDFLYQAAKNFSWFQSLSVKDQKARGIKDALVKELEIYSPVIQWAYEEKILALETWEDIVDSFIENYDDIAFNTKDPLTLELFAETMTMSQVYRTITNFLYDTMGIEVRTTKDLLKDENLMILLEQYDQHEEELIERIEQLPKFSDAHRAWFKTLVKRFGRFQAKYQTIYKDYIEHYEHLMPDVSLRYKLIFAMMKAERFHRDFFKQLERNPTLYLFILDSISFLDSVEKKETDLYYQVGQVYVALFLINGEDHENPQTIMPDQIFEHLRKHRYLLNEYSDLNKTINKIIHALLIERENGSYVEFLIDNGYLTKEDLKTISEHKDVRLLLNRQNQAYLNHILNRLDEEAD